jgi:peptide-methionine (S)-S-oxide reductase
MSPQLATFGAGCFWGVEELYRTLPGVVETSVGYEGGVTDNPTYEDVCSHTTKHAEVVQVTYDPEKISYEKLLEIFWHNHNPTTRNRQGPDIGDQYRSVIFYHSDEQQKLAELSKQALEESKRFSSPIVTSIEPAQTFYKAEEYHQQYLAKNNLSSCHL